MSSLVLKVPYNLGINLPDFNHLHTRATSSIFRAGNSSINRSVASAISSAVVHVLLAFSSLASLLISRLTHAHTA